MKKSNLGILTETDPWDPDAFEVRMTIEEHKDAKKQIQDQRQEVNRIKQECSREIQQVQEEAEKEFV